MSVNAIKLTNELHDYMLSVSIREPEILQKIRHFTQTELASTSRFLLAPEQGQLLAWLVKVLNAKRVLEIGTYTGYSSTAMALALPSDGQLVCCDISPHFTEHAERFWNEAGVQNKITLHSTPALETLTHFLAEPVALFDLVFIDADKSNYLAYYELSLKLVKTNGVIIFDNTLWHGAVIDPNEQDNSVIGIRELNQFLVRDERVDITLLPMGDGMTMLRKK